MPKRSRLVDHLKAGQDSLAFKWLAILFLPSESLTFLSNPTIFVRLSDGKNKMAATI